MDKDQLIAWYGKEEPSEEIFAWLDNQTWVYESLWLAGLYEGQSVAKELADADQS